MRAVGGAAAGRIRNPPRVLRRGGTARGSSPIEVLAEPAWREVARLLVGYVGLVQQLDSVAGVVAEALARQDPVVAGEAVEDVGRSGVPKQSRRTVIEALVSTMQGEDAEPRTRREAGLVLGRLGWRPEDLDAFVEVAWGPFLYGDEKKTREIPRRYWIGKYPVTNLQFDRFVQAGGYRRQELWSEDGWRRTGKGRDGPQSFGVDSENPIFPRVGVTWFEAEAYCRWLTSAATWRWAAT